MTRSREPILPRFVGHSRVPHQDMQFDAGVSNAFLTESASTGRMGRVISVRTPELDGITAKDVTNEQSIRKGCTNAWFLNLRQHCKLHSRKKLYEKNYVRIQQLWRLEKLRRPQRLRPTRDDKSHLFRLWERMRSAV